MAEPHDVPRTAILVIHGIGEQNPYETLDSFARGFVQYFLKRGPHAQPILRPERINHGDWTEVVLHVDVPPTPPHRPIHLTLFEFYWAPYTEGKVTFAGVLWWLVRTAITPLRYMADNLATLLAERAARANRTGRGPQDRFPGIVALFAREIARATFAYVPTLFFVGGAAWLISQLVPAVRKFAALAAGAAGPHPWALAGFVGTLIMALTMVWLLVQSLADALRRSSPSIERDADRWWLVFATVCLIGFGAVALFLAGASGLPVGRPELGAFLAGLGAAAAVALAAWLLRRVLVDYVGDIAVYVTADAKAASYTARSAILDASSDALARLLHDQPGDFDQVIVAGHSLGSVIAYDTINELFARVVATPDQLGSKVEPPLRQEDFARLRGLVTFGSPLDKVYYFFREHVHRDQAVRAQILSFLHAFRRVETRQSYGAFKFTDPAGPDARRSPFGVPTLAPFTWVNVWAPLDPVSGHLDFYAVDAQVRRWYWIWGLAHMRYWGDPRLYAAIAEAFRL